MKNDFVRCNSQWRLMRYLLGNNWIITSDKEDSIRQGNGMSVVFVNAEKTRALRINNGSWKDFALYVDVARALPHNPYFQNIGHDFFLDDGTYCVELEPLLEANDPQAPIQSRGRYTILTNLINRPFKNSRPEMIDRLLKRDPALRDAMSAMFAFHQRAFEQDPNFDPYLDLHGRNFMIRPNEAGGDVVISDPFARSLAGVSKNVINPSDILWRRKLGFLDFQDCEKTDWAITSGQWGMGALKLPL